MKSRVPLPSSAAALPRPLRHNHFLTRFHFHHRTLPHLPLLKPDCSCEFRTHAQNITNTKLSTKIGSSKYSSESETRSKYSEFRK